VNLNHPLQGRKTDKIHSPKAVIDTIPYSRVFYYAYPGAMIMHRGIQYKVICMDDPPTTAIQQQQDGTDNLCINYNFRNVDLAAYAQPTKEKYMTRALRSTIITVVKRMEYCFIVDTKEEMTSENKNRIKNKSHSKENKNDTVAVKGRVNTKKIIAEKRSIADTACKNINECVGVAITFPDNGCANTIDGKNKGFIQQIESHKQQQQLSKLSIGVVASNGVVNIKRKVWGYAKLSLITRNELSRTELSLPTMEYDTNAFWIDTEAPILKYTLQCYDEGVHALSHAVLAVSHLFVSSNCLGGDTVDMDCDHSYRNATRLIMFDVRPGGGTHTIEQMWNCLDLVLAEAIKLLDECDTCSNNYIKTQRAMKGDESDDDDYDGGCPACLQSCPCLAFHHGLSRGAGLIIGRRMLQRLEKSGLCDQLRAKRSALPLATFRKTTEDDTDTAFDDSDKQFNKNKGCRNTVDISSPIKCTSNNVNITLKLSPRKLARDRAFRNAKNLSSARNRNIVIGRMTWPMDHVGGGSGHDADEDDCIHYNKYITGPLVAQNDGYMTRQLQKSKDDEIYHDING